MLVIIDHIRASSFARLRVELLIAGLLHEVGLCLERIVCCHPPRARFEHRELVLLAIEVGDGGQAGGLGLDREREVLLRKRAVYNMIRVEHGVLAADVRDARVRVLAATAIAITGRLARNHPPRSLDGLAGAVERRHEGAEAGLAVLLAAGDGCERSGWHRHKRVSVTLGIWEGPQAHRCG